MAPQGLNLLNDFVLICYDMDDKESHNKTKWKGSDWFFVLKQEN